MAAGAGPSRPWGVPSCPRTHFGRDIRGSRAWGARPIAHPGPRGSPRGISPPLQLQTWTNSPGEGPRCRRGNRGTEPGWPQHPPRRGGRMPEQEAAPWRHGRGPGASRVSLRPRGTGAAGDPPASQQGHQGMPCGGWGASPSPRIPVVRAGPSLAWVARDGGTRLAGPRGPASLRGHRGHVPAAPAHGAGSFPGPDAKGG